MLRNFFICVGLTIALPLFLEALQEKDLLAEAHNSSLSINKSESTSSQSESTSSEPKKEESLKNTKAAAQPNPSPTDKKQAVSKELIKKRKKRGGQLYEKYATAIHTKRLHNEFTPAQWKTILLQKRIRVPLTASEHRDLLLFFVNEKPN